jgi:hypothetical protein
VPLVRIDVSEECIASIIRVERINELGKHLGATLLEFRQTLVRADVVLSSLILSTLMVDAVISSETPVLTRATRRHIPEDGDLHSLPCSRIPIIGYNSEPLELRFPC